MDSLNIFSSKISLGIDISYLVYNNKWIFQENNTYGEDDIC